VLCGNTYFQNLNSTYSTNDLIFFDKYAYHTINFLKLESTNFDGKTNCNEYLVPLILIKQISMVLAFGFNICTSFGLGFGFVSGLYLKTLSLFS
jgi:hypothetical protein